MKNVLALGAAVLALALPAIALADVSPAPSTAPLPNGQKVTPGGMMSTSTNKKGAKKTQVSPSGVKDRSGNGSMATKKTQPKTQSNLPSGQSDSSAVAPPKQ